MCVSHNKLGIVLMAMITALALAIPDTTYAQRGGGGSRGGGGGGHGGGGGRAGGNNSGGHGGGGRGEGHGGVTPQGNNYGGGRGNSGPNWNSNGSGRGNQNYGGNRGNQYDGGGNRGNGRSGYSNLNQFYGGQYGSGYRGNNFGYGGGYGYGHPGFGPSYGNYGYGYFPWYIGLATYGTGIGRGYANGGYNGYANQSSPQIIERTVESSTAQTVHPGNDYVPQLNSTTAVLGAQSSGAAVLGVTMDPQYPDAAVVRQVTPGSAAEKGGLRAGDMFTAIDQAEIRNPADVTSLVATKRAGDQLAIAFIRPVLRSEVKEAAPEKGLGIPTAVAPESGEQPQPIAPPVPAAPLSFGN